MTTETKHTPTPWQNVAGQITKSGRTNTLVAEYPITNEGEANAAFIVRCVNAHEPLLAYAECEAAYNDKGDDSYRPTFLKYGWDGNQSARPFLTALRNAALRKARGEA